MKRALTIWSALVALSLPLGILLGTVLATPASATTYGSFGDHDSHAYWLEARDDGYLGTEDDAEHMMIDVCIERGYYTEGEAIQAAERYRFYTSNQAHNSAKLATTVVVSAEYHECEVFYRHPTAGMPGL